jgi:hypothetical protein
MTDSGNFISTQLNLVAEAAVVARRNMVSARGNRISGSDTQKLGSLEVTAATVATSATGAAGTELFNGISSRPAPVSQEKRPKREEKPL